MKTIHNKIKRHKGKVTADLFRNEKGAIDLVSIMVGVIVIGLIGGVIASTVFVVIPWTQDNAAKQQLDSIASAESAYMGMSSAIQSPLPAGYVANSFGNSAQLKAANLLQVGPTYCAVTPADGKSYSGYSRSDSGTVWVMNDKNTQPVVLTGAVPTECGFTNPAAAPAIPAPYVDPTPTVTSLTYQCDTTTSGTLPWQGALTGTETWDDGTAPKSYTNAILDATKTLTAGKTYKVTFDGTYNAFSSTSTSGNLTPCLISMDHWGSNTGVVNASYAFWGASKLTSVPPNIPSSITDMSYMFRNASVFNSPINSWDIHNVTSLKQMFFGASNFNQPLNSWNTSKVTTMNILFGNAFAFNQPLDKWDTSKVTDLSAAFYYASNFNQPLSTWDTSSVTTLSETFRSATSFNQNISNWNTNKVTDMNYMFLGASSFNQPVNTWTTSNVTTMRYMFREAPKFDQSLNTWNTSKVTDMNNMFFGASNFNQSVNTWNVSNVIDMNGMFYGTSKFNQPLNTWSTVNVVDMSYMFYNSTNFNQNIKSWNVAKVTQSSNFRTGSALTAANSPF